MALDRSLWRRIRQLLPRMLTMWQRCSSRSSRAAAMTSSCRMFPQSSNPLFEVSIVDARPYQLLISWKNSFAHLAVTER